MAGTFSDQITSIYSSLSQFFLSESKAAADTTGTVLPAEFRDYQGGLDYSEILRIALACRSSAPSQGNGAAIDAISDAVAAMREYEMCTRSKLGYVTNRINYNNSDSTFLSNEGVEIGNKAKGK